MLPGYGWNAFIHPDLPITGMVQLSEVFFFFFDGFDCWCRTMQYVLYVLCSYIIMIDTRAWMFFFFSLLVPFFLLCISSDSLIYIWGYRVGLMWSVLYCTVWYYIIQDVTHPVLMRFFVWCDIDRSIEIEWGSRLLYPFFFSHLHILLVGALGELNNGIPALRYTSVVSSSEPTISRFVWYAEKALRATKVPHLEKFALVGAPQPSDWLTE